MLDDDQVQLAFDSFQNIDDLDDLEVAQPGQRLVQQQQLRFQGQRDPDFQHPLGPVGKLRGSRSGDLLQPHQAEGFVAGVHRVFVPGVFQHEPGQGLVLFPKADTGQDQVLARRSGQKPIRAGRSGRCTFSTLRLGVAGVDVFPLEQDPPRAGQKKSRKHVEEGGFARAVGPDDAQRLLAFVECSG